MPVAVLDVRMPQTSGLEVQARLREVSPDTKVILMTGGATSTIRAAALQGARLPFWTSLSKARGFSTSFVKHFAPQRERLPDPAC